VADYRRDLADALTALAALYREMGEEDKASRALQEARRLRDSR
jgi:hypothetical protein